MFKFFHKKVIYGCEAFDTREAPYMTRYTIFECDAWQVCLHRFHRSDGDDMHDHPWPFVTLILWGGYFEATPGARDSTAYTWYRPGRVLFRRAAHRHRVILNDNRKAVTLVVMGRKVRDWGFWVRGTWVQWEKYFKKAGCL